STVEYEVDFQIASTERRVVTAWGVRESGDDELLVESARQGDRDAFASLYDRYARMVHGILLARVPPCEVDDLVQEAFLSALRQLHALRDVSRFGAWLATITRNRANDYFRKSIPEGARSEPVPDAQTGNRSDEATNQEAAMILASIRTLPEAY